MRKLLSAVLAAFLALAAVAPPALAVEIFVGNTDRTFLGTTSVTDLLVSGTATFNKNAEGSAEDPIVEIRVSDDSTASWKFANGTSAVSTFIPVLRGTGNAANIAAFFEGRATTDTGTNPVMILSGRVGASTAVVTRPLFSFRNLSADVLQGLPLNSGANLALSWGTQADANPTFSGSGRSIGSRLVLYNSLAASATDNAIGTSASGVYQWYGIPQALSTHLFRWWAGQTEVMRLRGDGQLITYGGRVVKLRVATTTPVTGAVTDHIIVTNMASASAVTVNLPASPTAGQELVIKDGKGDAATNNVTITPAAGNIDGAATLVLSTNYGRAKLIYNGTEWSQID